MPDWRLKLREQLETLAGVAATFFVGYIPPIVLVFLVAVAAERRLWGWAVMTAAGAIVGSVVAVWVTRLAGSALYERYPEFNPKRMLKRNSSPEQLVGALESQTRSIQQSLEAIEGRPPAPFALLMAARLSRVPLALRPFLSLWWLAHFASGVGCGLLAARLTLGRMQNPLLALAIVLPVALQVAFLFAVNLYLLMAPEIRSEVP
jgi:hypothetical protein